MTDSFPSPSSQSKKGAMTFMFWSKGISDSEQRKEIHESMVKKK
jgi:hypothetical protein